MNGGIHEIIEYILNTHPSDFLPRIPDNLKDLPDELKDGEEYYFLGGIETDRLGAKYIPGAQYFDKYGNGKEEDKFWTSLKMGLDFYSGNPSRASGKMRIVLRQRESR